MSSRIFQSVIIQMKDATTRQIGVVDSEGIVLASTDLSAVGTSIGSISSVSEEQHDDVVVYSGMTFKSLMFDAGSFYAVFTVGTDEIAATLCKLASIALNEVGLNFIKNNDKRAFIKSIISENILQEDILVRASELNFSAETKRGVLVVRLDPESVLSAIDLVSDIVSDNSNDDYSYYVITTNDTDIVVVKDLSVGNDSQVLLDLAKTIQEKISSELGVNPVIGVGTPAHHLRELAEKYKEANISIDIGVVFDSDQTIINYETLGIGRLIYKLPTTVCEIFLSEAFKRNPIEALDQETLYTIDKFFENSLNVSETSRKLFVHRNTLVYRIEKIKKLTGLDLREFDHAIVFKVALMVKKYLLSQESKY